MDTAIMNTEPDVVFAPLTVDGEATGQVLHMSRAMAENLQTAGGPVTVRGSTRVMGPMGDFLIVWTDADDEKVLEAIQKKLDAGYTFFIVKSRMFGLIEPERIALTNVKRQKKALLAARTVELKDADFSLLVDSGNAATTEAQAGGVMETERISRDPKEIAKSDTVAVPQRVGG